MGELRSVYYGKKDLEGIGLRMGMAGGNMKKRSERRSIEQLGMLKVPVLGILAQGHENDLCGVSKYGKGTGEEQDNKAENRCLNWMSLRCASRVGTGDISAYFINRVGIFSGNGQS